MLTDFAIILWLRYLLDLTGDKFSKDSKKMVRRIIKVLQQREKRKKEKYK